MNKHEVARKLTKVNQIMDELIYAFMQTEMSYKQAEEEVFRMVKRTRSTQGTEDEVLSGTGNNVKESASPFQRLNSLEIQGS